MALAHGVTIEIESLEQIPQIPNAGETVSKNDLYVELSAVGNSYGPAFAGVMSITLAADASQAISSLDVPDIGALMPAKYQRSHIIHPSTLDIILHTALPLAGRRLGLGSMMPVHIEELVPASPRGWRNPVPPWTSRRSSRRFAPVPQ